MNWMLIFWITEIMSFLKESLLGSYINYPSRRNNQTHIWFKNKSWCEKGRNQDELVEVDPLLFKEIQSVVMQKGIPIYFYFVSQNILVHPGKVPYLLKGSAKLRKSKAQPKEHVTNLESFRIGATTASTRTESNRLARTSAFSAPTIEMHTEEEKKEDWTQGIGQRHLRSRRE